MFLLVCVIIHKGKPISFYIRKGTDVQKIYTVTLIELQIIVEPVKN